MRFKFPKMFSRIEVKKLTMKRFCVTVPHWTEIKQTVTDSQMPCKSQMINKYLPYFPSCPLSYRYWTPWCSSTVSHVCNQPDSNSHDIPALSRIQGHTYMAFTYKTYCHANHSSIKKGMTMTEWFVQQAYIQGKKKHQPGSFKLDWGFLRYMPFSHKENQEIMQIK